MEISNLVVREGLVAQKNRSVPQLIQVSISTADIDSGVAYLEWHNVTNDGLSLADPEPIVTAQVVYGTAGDYLSSWVPALHLVQGRIEALSLLADDGIANRLSNSMAYLLFADRLVDYAGRYQGMQSVILHGLEAFAEVRTKPDDEGGIWTVPPFFIDSVCHLAGFVMNVSDAIDTKSNFCVTPGWGSLRIARPLVAGGKYRSYTKMIATAEDPTVYLGDVYVLEGNEIIGVVQAMKFRRYPRVLLNRFFTPADIKNPVSGSTPCVNSASSSTQSTKLVSASAPPPKPANVAEPAPTPAPAPAPEPLPVQKNKQDTAAPPVGASDGTSAKALQLVADEAAIELSDLQDDVSFANLGVDSLMSLVIAEKLRQQLGITVSGSLFLEYPTVRDLRVWLDEYYS